MAGSALGGFGHLALVLRVLRTNGQPMCRPLRGGAFSDRSISCIS
jgi:hypothetical protein